MNAIETLLSLPTVPADLLAKVGEAMACAAARVQGDDHAAALELERLEELGLQLQTAARVLAAPGALRLERVDLGVAALQARAEWAGAFARAGAAWDGPQQGCLVLTSAPLLKQLLDLAVGHALGLGSELAFDVLLRGEPPLATIRIVVTRPGSALFEARPGDAAELHWALLSLLARHAGVVAERQVQALAVELSLGFPPQGAVTVSPAAEPAGLPTTPLPAGCRVLLLEPHEATRVQAERLMLAAGLEVNAVATIDQARGAWARSVPDCLVTGIATADSLCSLFVDDLRAARPGLCVLELVDLPYVFDTSLPGAGRPARIARIDMVRNLVPALAQELSAQR